MKLSITIIGVCNKYTDFEIHNDKTFFTHRNKTPIEKWAFCRILRTLKAAFLKITDSSILQEISKSGMILLMYRYFLTMANGLISHVTYNG